jgi:hypothetical protein
VQLSRIRQGCRSTLLYNMVRRLATQKTAELIPELQEASVRGLTDGVEYDTL